jgi:coenzyme PQQ precursor peptide PqqA
MQWAGCAACNAKPITPLHRNPHGICLGVRRPKKSEKERKRAANGKEDSMAWTTPVLVEICIGLEINGYLPPEF